MGPAESTMDPPRSGPMGPAESTMDHPRPRPRPQPAPKRSRNSRSVVQMTTLRLPPVDGFQTCFMDNADQRAVAMATADGAALPRDCDGHALFHDEGNINVPRKACQIVVGVAAASRRSAARACPPPCPGRAVAEMPFCAGLTKSVQGKAKRLCSPLPRGLPVACDVRKRLPRR